MNDSIELSVIIPAYNEEKRLGNYLASVSNYLENKKRSYEIIVVDDGSTDRTSSLVEDYRMINSSIRLIRLQHNKGKGHAVKTGMLQATGRLRLFADADGATPITEVERLILAVELGAEVAIASRALHDDKCIINAHIHRKIIGTIFNFLARSISVKGIADTQCGFKLFCRPSAEAIFPLQRIQDFGFDIELLYLCQEKGIRISEIPVTWTDVKGSKVNIVIDSFRMFRDLFLVRLNEMRGFYEERSEK